MVIGCLDTSRKLSRKPIIIAAVLLCNQKLRSRSGQIKIQSWKSKIHTAAVCHQSWKIGKVNHVAIATPDIDKAAALYRDVLGAKVSEKHPQAEHGVYTVFVELGDTKIELLTPLGDKSPILKFLESHKSGGMHHICLEVDDIEAAMTDLKAKNIRFLSDKSKIGAHGKPVVFIHPKDCNGVLVELEQI